MKVEDIICETLLNSYKDLERMCEKVDRLVLNIATQPASCNTSIFNVFDKTTELINEKIAYCNIKVLIDEAFERIGASTELQYKYMLGYRNKDIEEIFELSQTCATHRIIRQKKNLFEKIQQRYDKNKLLDLIKSSKTLTYKYNFLMEENNKKKELSNDI